MKLSPDHVPYCVTVLQQSATATGAKSSSQTGVITAPPVTCKRRCCVIFFFFVPVPHDNVAARCIAVYLAIHLHPFFKKNKTKSLCCCLQPNVTSQRAVLMCVNSVHSVFSHNYLFGSFISDVIPLTYFGVFFHLITVSHSVSVSLSKSKMNV